MAGITHQGHKNAKIALQAAAIGMAFASFAAHAAPAQTAEQLYQANCAACHGTKLEGAVGPTLGQHAWIHGAPTKANLIKVISKGVPERICRPGRLR
jgi:mono/diheme cytochrome c family protein